MTTKQDLLDLIEEYGDIREDVGYNCGRLPWVINEDADSFLEQIKEILDEIYGEQTNADDNKN